MRVATVIGARPQLIKAAAVSRVLRQHHTEILIHTGQHYDPGMSDVFFDELQIDAPAVNLAVGSGMHGEQTAAMLAGIERVLVNERPDWVMVYGDTNSTLAGALAASKLRIPIAHVEAGLRSFNRAMPEETNRVVADHLSDLLLCPSRSAVENLAAEGIRAGVHVVGDVMFDALMFARDRAQTRSDVLTRLGLAERRYVVATVHRAENTDDPARLAGILGALDQSAHRVVFPVHPRTRKVIARSGAPAAGPVSFIDPLGYLDMVRLVGGARAVVTDSGGLQKEAYWLAVPCVTVRDETEWVETVAAGWNTVVGSDRDRIVAALRHFAPPAHRPAIYGEAGAAERCVRLLAPADVAT
jgi:UDP-N-acetylglucosamine 2-epimerase